MAHSATLQLHGKWCYTRQFFVQLVSQRLTLLRCSYMKGGVTLDNVLCNLSRNVSICYVAVTWKVPWCYNLHYTRKQIVTGSLPEQYLNNIVGTTILVSIVSTILLSNDDVIASFDHLHIKQILISQ